MVKISRRDRDFIKNSETKTRDLKFETETRDFIIYAFCQFFFLMSSSLRTWIFFKFLAFFRRILVVSHLQIQQTKIVELRNFNKPFLCNIQSLETWNLRDRDRDTQKWVSRRASRPRPSLETPSLILVINVNFSVTATCVFYLSWLINWTFSWT